MLDGLFKWLAGLLGTPEHDGPARDYTAAGVRDLIALESRGRDPIAVFVHAALEIGIEGPAWKAGGTFRKTRSLFNRHIGSGKGYWTGEHLDVLHADGRPPERLRVYASLSECMKDYDQLLNDPLYAAANVYAKSGPQSREKFYDALAAAGYDKADYGERLKRREKTLRAAGLI